MEAAIWKCLKFFQAPVGQMLLLLLGLLLILSLHAALVPAPVASGHQARDAEISPLNLLKGGGTSLWPKARISVEAAETMTKTFTVYVSVSVSFLCFST